MTPPRRATDEGLVRAIGPVPLGLNMINLTVGGGIFVLPGLVAAQLGAAASVAYLVCSVAVGLVFLCFAEIGSRVTRSGGAYAYIEEAFGPFAGFVASVLLWFGWNVLSDAALTVALTDTMATAIPALQAPPARALFIVALCGGMAGVNIVGVRSGVRFLVVNTIAKLVPLVGLMVGGLLAMDPQLLRFGEWPGLERIGGAALILFFAFAGAESALDVSGEIDHPSRTVPRGLALGMGGILALYLGLQTASQGVLGPELAGNTEAPLAAVARAVFGEWGARALLAGSVISIFATLSGDILATPRVLFASAHDGHLPAWLALVHPRFQTPHRAIAFFATMIAVLAVSGTFKPLAVVASGSILVIYMGVSLAVLRLRRRDGLPAPGTLRLPAGPLVPLLSCLVLGWLLWQLTASEALGLAALVAVAILGYGARAAAGRIAL
jgi:basic amino acid/polyamine antiporter, APA family